ncbi:MAG: O-antigen ligase family protein, partial [Verrucomicrobiota bacterium]
WLVPGYGRTITNGIGGLFNQPDHFAIFLAALVPLWLGLCFLGRESRTFRFFWISLAVISVLFLAISGSVSGWLTLFTGGICFAVLAAYLAWDRLRFSKRRLLLISGSLVALMLILTASYGSGAILRNVGHGLLADGSAGAMPSLWKSGLKQVVESPIVGTGSRSSQIYGRLFRGEELGTGASEPQFLHNEYLQVLADYGILGLTLVLALLAVHFFYGARFLSSFRAIRPARGERIAKSNHLALCVGAFSALVALAGAACFDFILHLPVVAVLASFLLAILAVPDPMSQLDKKVGAEPLIPGGSLLFGVRAIGFGGGLVLLGLGAVFVQSEYHFEMARKGVERGDRIYLQYRHLQNARELDPRNPFIQTLSAHAQVGSIESDMPLAERRQALEKADLYFSTAQQLYPQDIFAAMGHVAVLDELGRRVRARERLREAREWAPLYGNLMRAEAEHYLRNGQIGLAQEAFSESLQAPAFRDEAASREGLGTVSEWKLIALQNGIPLDALDSDGSGNEMRRIFPDAVVDERAVAGQASPSQ